MKSHRITRREVLAASAAAALPLVASSTASAATEVPPATVGVSTLGFPKHTNQQLAEELAKHGIHNVQLFLNQSDSRYWKFNGRTDTSDMDDTRCKTIADAYRAKDIAIHSIGVYTNLIHPDEAERAANLAYFDDMMRIGAAMGVRTFVNEAGHYEPDEPKPGLEYRFLEDVWHRTVATGKQLAELAERHDATVLLEPYFGSFFASAKRTRLFIEEVGSPRLRVLLDPANLLELNDLDEMFAQLAPWIDCFHAKDRKLHVGGGVPAGKGDIDYGQFVALATKHAPKAPFFLEYVGPDDYLPALELLQDALKQNGRTSDVSAS